MRGRISERLKELERTPAWLAGKLDVDRSLVHRWLTGERPIPERRLREIALVLGVKPDELRPNAPTTEGQAAA